MLKHACMFWYPAQVIGPFHKSLELKTNDKKTRQHFAIQTTTNRYLFLFQLDLMDHFRKTFVWTKCFFSENTKPLLTLPPWQWGFSSIVGPNGSGKHGTQRELSAKLIQKTAKKHVCWASTGSQMDVILHSSWHEQDLVISHNPESSTWFFTIAGRSRVQPCKSFEFKVSHFGSWHLFPFHHCPFKMALVAKPHADTTAHRISID